LVIRRFTSEVTKLDSASRRNPGPAPAGSLLVLYANDPNVAALLDRGACSIAKTITHVAGGKTAVILRRHA
jgi:hypothetical protein